MSDNDLLWTVSISILVSFIFGIMAGFVVAKDGLQKQAIEKGFAQYNAENGEWQWNTSTIKIEKE